jgi:tetratricopeptide (TPR) repeat protein
MASRAPLLFLFSAALAAVLAGCGTPLTPARRIADRGQLRTHLPASEFREATEQYLSGDFERARNGFHRIASDSPGARDRAWAQYWLGRSEYALDRLGPARRALESALAAARAGRGADRGVLDLDELRAYARAALARVALAQRRPAEALDLLDSLDRQGLSGKVAADELFFLRALAQELFGMRESAKGLYEGLARVFPQSELAGEAASRARGFVEPQYEARAGVFESPLSAEPVAKALRRRGFRARVGRVAVGGELRYAVSLGRFSSREDADALAREAEQSGFPASRVRVVEASRRRAGVVP